MGSWWVPDRKTREEGDARPSKSQGLVRRTRGKNLLLWDTYLP